MRFHDLDEVSKLTAKLATPLSVVPVQALDGTFTASLWARLVRLCC